MKTNRIWSFLPSGVREPLAIFLIVGIAAIVGSFTGKLDLYTPFALWPDDVWYGRVWQMVTYVLLPGSPANLIFYGFLFVVLGTRLVQVLGTGRFWLFCLVGALGTAITKLALARLNSGGII